MSEEQARQRAQELTKKALAEAEKETFKIDRSLQGKHIVTKLEKAEKKKEEKRIEKEMRRSADKPTFLVSLAGIFEKFLHIIVTLYTMVFGLHCNQYSLLIFIAKKGAVLTEQHLFLFLHDSMEYFLHHFLLSSIF